MTEIFQHALYERNQVSPPEPLYVGLSDKLTRGKFKADLALALALNQCAECRISSRKQIAPGQQLEEPRQRQHARRAILPILRRTLRLAERLKKTPARIGKRVKRRKQRRAKSKTA